MNDTIYLLLAITDSYVPYCGVTLASLFENNKDNNCCVYIACEDLREESISKLKALSLKYNQQIIFVQPSGEKLQIIKDTIKKVPNPIHISSYYRLLVTELVSNNIDKIIYLDCDLIVKGNLRLLWNELMEESIALCAVHDFVRLDDYFRLQIDENRFRYYNAGVLVINLAYWRKYDVSMQCINYMQNNYAKLLLADQDILNAVLMHDVKYVHPRYNTMSLFWASEEYLSVCTWYSDIEKIRASIAAPVIVHFANNKPWHKGWNLPYREEWLYYLSKTAWSELEISYRGGIWGYMKDKSYNLIYKLLGRCSKKLRLLYHVSPYKKENL